MHLDRDDRGVFADQINVNGVKVQNPINQETVTVRATQSGEYVVNLLHYKSNYSVPLPVTVKVEKLNPNVSLVYYDTVELTAAVMKKPPCDSPWMRTAQSPTPINDQNSC